MGAKGFEGSTKWPQRQMLTLCTWTLEETEDQIIQEKSFLQELPVTKFSLFTNSLWICNELIFQVSQHIIFICSGFFQFLNVNFYFVLKCTTIKWDCVSCKISSLERACSLLERGSIHSTFYIILITFHWSKLGGVGRNVLTAVLHRFVFETKWDNARKGIPQCEVYLPLSINGYDQHQSLLTETRQSLGLKAIFFIF